MIPINKTAALVTQKASRYNQFSINNRDKKVNILFWKAPRPSAPLPEHDNFTDITGLMFGRLRVVSYLGNGRWQCRCLCSNYTSRKAKAATNPNNNVDACEECRELAFLKREHQYRRTGKNQNIKDFY